MTKTTSLFCVTAALLCLTIGNAVAEDKPETQQAMPDMTNNQETQSEPKPKPEMEKAASKRSSQNNAAKEEPDCN